MRHTIESLLTGANVADWYRVARRHWTEVLVDIDPTDADAIASKASTANRAGLSAIAAADT